MSNSMLISPPHTHCCVSLGQKICMPLVYYGDCTMSSKADYSKKNFILKLKKKLKYIFDYSIFH